MKIRYAGLEKNDFIDGKGVNVSFWTQGCPHRCEGCHNPETWSFEGGIEEDEDILLNEILNSIKANGILRNLSLLGGEPLCEQNIDFILKLTSLAKQKYPDITIYCWTGYTIENIDLKYLENIDVLIDGPFIQKQRDITLDLRGSTNQRVLYKGIDF